MVKNIKRADRQEHDDTNKIKKSMTMPSLKVIKELLRNREEFLARTRFDKDNMNKLWEVCQLCPIAEKLKDFLMGERVLEIFQGAPYRKPNQNQKNEPIFLI